VGGKTFKMLTAIPPYVGVVSKNTYTNWTFIEEDKVVYRLKLTKEKTTLFRKRFIRDGTKAI